MTRIYVFPGQGSQKVGMGAGLFERFPAQVAAVDAVLGYSIADLCLQDPGGQLNQTQFTQPALFVVNALTFLARVADTGELPQFAAGHSLGEYDALLAAGVFDLPTGVRIVQQRAALMSQARGGAMAAVVGLPADRIRGILAESGFAGVDLANLNAPSQTVISGPEAEIVAALPVFEKAGAQLVKRLPVSAAFHSRYMAGAERDFAAFLDTVSLAAPRIPVLSNVTAQLHEASTMKSLLARQISHPVRWTECVQWLLQKPGAEFHELGPGTVLTGLIRRIRSEAR